MKHSHTLTHGFTLVETIVATFLFVGLVGAVSGFAIFFFKNFSFSFEEQQSVNLIQGAVTRISRDIREARTGNQGAWPIIFAGDNEFIFYSDVTNDGRTDRVRYFLDGNILKRGIVEPTQVPVDYPLSQEKITIIASNIDLGGNTLFTYYNGLYPSNMTNNPLPSPSRLLSTRLVTVYLRSNISGNTISDAYEASASIQIRSMKDNL